MSIKEKVFYHGNENPIHRFSEIRPNFFSEDYKYCLGYGKYVEAYRINSNKAFDTATNEDARQYYNDVFLKDELGKDAKEIAQGEHISFLDADNFWAFIAVEKELGNISGFDSIIIEEFSSDVGCYDTNLSIIPFDNVQIEKVKSLDFDTVSSSPVLTEIEADEQVELMLKHQRGNCHSLSSYLAKQGYGEIMIIKPSNNENEIIHSFIKHKNGLSIDAGGIMPIYKMLQRYMDCAVDGDISNLKVEKVELLDLLKMIKPNKKEIKLAEKYWDMTYREYASEIKSMIGTPVLPKNNEPEVSL